MTRLLTLSGPDWQAPLDLPATANGGADARFFLTHADARDVVEWAAIDAGAGPPALGELPEGHAVAALP